MKIALLGCKGTTLDILHLALQTGEFQISQVITLPEELGKKNKVANFMGEEIKEYCASKSIPCHISASYHLKEEKDFRFFELAKIDLLIVIGWERLVPDEILNTLGKFSCGMHGSAFGLPRGRGRSPLNWALITDQKKFITYLFKYDPGIDSGDIIGFKAFDINPFDTISSLHRKNRIVMYQLLKTYLPLLENNSVTFYPQPPETPTFYPKRNEEDGFIDWSLTTSEIYNLIRALGPPYPTAFAFAGETKIHIQEAFPFEESLYNNRVSPGSILDVSLSENQFVVKTSDGSLLIKTFTGINIRNLEIGSILLSGKKEETLTRIRLNYPSHLPDNQKEI